ncbi:hypothetical protein [Vagococcus xieshaowenii]|uniref:Uncharacterized protein n=1 Tax=Vagococcus xieshaowenii TaxID=2562451 RepID=A0AAJ5EEC6_9ENTE|nr:hypothetical protein [Vagococcus xieshaowenii]QCA28998.1 hypothetical protein E4Z98_06610 [Vagococcus xieshaowenii]TFZ41026.1 hypothetical protein E4031_06485 [Vagococcus xieshaowenii]
MYNKIVAGTVMLNTTEGKQLFLLHQENNVLDFAVTNVSEDKTSLASILDFLKNMAKLNLDHVELVELTSINIDNRSVPLYLFELDGNNVSYDLGDSFLWETPANLRELLSVREIKGDAFLI